jgi:hypothetical protein
MVSVITKEFDKPRFLNRKEFEEIKIRHNRLPRGKWKFEMGDTKEIIKLGNDKILFEVHHPGLVSSLVYIQEDIERLIQHVEMADVENDRLLAEIERLKNEKSNQQEEVL